MLIQRETPSQIAAIRSVTAAAFLRPDQPDTAPAEAGLVDALRASEAWLPELSLVAIDSGGVEGGGVAGGGVVGHVLCSRARVGTAAVLGLGPLSVHPDHQRRGVGKALMHAVLGAADALGEPLVVLLGNPAYYSRFGFRPAAEFAITPPVQEWRPHFQARALTTFTPALRGAFAYAEPFNRM